MQSLPCDIVLLPDPSLSHEAVVKSRELAQYGSLFVLGGSIYPHLSLYMTQLKVEDLTKVNDILGSIARVYAPVMLTADQYYQKDGYVDASYMKVPEVTSLQAAVVNALNPVRDGLREKDKIRMSESEGIALQNLQNYGYRFVGELFRPHITLTRFNDDDPSVLEALDDVGGFSGLFTKLGVFEMGDNGTAIRSLIEVKLLGAKAA